MKIDLKTKICNIQGKPYTLDEAGSALTLGMVIAEVLANAPEGGKMKMWTLAQAAYNEDTMDVDAADFLLIKKALSNSKSYGSSNIILGQSLQLLEAIEQ